MSSILKALKKLENESDHSIEKTDLESNDMNNADMSKSITNKLNMEQIGKISGTLIFILIIAWLGFNFNRTPTHLPDETYQQIPEKTHTVKKTKNIPPSEPTLTSQQAPITNEKKLPPDPPDLPDEDILEKDSKITHIPENQADIISKEDKPKDGAILYTNKEPINKMDITPTNETSETLKGPENDYTGTERISDASWLKLQAISWTSDPLTRIAVINNEIIKEGHAVDKGKVIHIDQNFVIIQSDAKKWRLEFGLN